jgi:hypothetical protein
MDTETLPAYFRINTPHGRVSVDAEMFLAERRIPLPPISSNDSPAAVLARIVNMPNVESKQQRSNGQKKRYLVMPNEAARTCHRRLESITEEDVQVAACSKARRGALYHTPPRILDHP